MNQESIESSQFTTPPGAIEVEPLHLRLQSLIEHALRSQPASTYRIVGTDSLSALAAFLATQNAGEIHNRPHLVICEDESLCTALIENLKFFDPLATAVHLPAFDVSLYSNLYPHHKYISQRINWVYQAQNAKRGQIFTATLKSLLQKTLPFQVLSSHIQVFKKGDTLPDPFASVLENLGYSATPLVEDVGTYALRGGILDLFSPAHPHPIRLELFGDIIESIKTFDPVSQRSLESLPSFTLLPSREVLYNDDNRQRIAQEYKKTLSDTSLPEEEYQPLLHSIAKGHYFPGVDFLLPFFYDRLDLPIEHFSQGIHIWYVNPPDCLRAYDQFLGENKNEREASDSLIFPLDDRLLFSRPDELDFPEESFRFELSRVDFLEESEPSSFVSIEYPTPALRDFAQSAAHLQKDTRALSDFLREKFFGWRRQDYQIFIASSTVHQAQRIQLLVERAGLKVALVDENHFHWDQWREQQKQDADLIHIIPRTLSEGVRLNEENIIFLRDEDILGKKKVSRQYKDTGSLERRTHALSFGDLSPGDLIVHKLHGIGVYEGLKAMSIGGVDSELIQIQYKDGDKLYLPVYRIGQITKYSGPSEHRALDKLGSQNWSKTKTKVRSQLRDLAAELLELYAKRAQMHRPPFSDGSDDLFNFENAFPYEETEDQLRAIEDIKKDMTSDRPMDRLVCGDVGFGKTEVAMRAAFIAARDGRQVAVIAPTTILTFQHQETFRKRFKGWPIEIRSLNRFVPPAEVKKTLADLKAGKVDIIIGTHRLFSRDVEFKNLGLLIIDEEQKFGVKHKEKIRKLKNSVDTLALSATPIPRTLNLSLMGIRDLSLINTAPVDRLPTRTFVTKKDMQTIRKAVMSEIQRGGQVFFIHNRIQSIESVAAEIREAMPEVRFAIAHGQTDEDQLEKTMLKFFHHELDLLLCTTIIESGMDIPRANTMFIDNAHQLGLSQLYQLRGRVGRSKERAYCYLLIPSSRVLDRDAQERLRVIQENTALGSGIRIAQHDLELRGAGDILGEDQSGHINAVGYELYMELLEETLQAQRGDAPLEEKIEPEINLRIPALIPDTYMPDIRLRLAYYKALSEIESSDDLARIEDDLRDQFGPPPEPVANLMGLMLIRKTCRNLGIKDLSAGTAWLSLTFSEKTPLPPAKVVELSLRENKKYQITPDNRLNIRMKQITWPRTYDELSYLLTLC